MTTQAIQEVRAAHEQLGARFAALEAAIKPQTYAVPGAEITLQPGEHYAGIVLGADGTPSHHLILLPGEADDIKWKAALKWAEKQGGELPTRQEQALLFANLKGEFQGAWYWSNQQHESDEGYAWAQDFYDGYQSFFHHYVGLRARAVRRLTIQ